MNDQTKINVLFVCMGNICRSPSAEGVFEKLASESRFAGRLELDSAGTHAYHEGEPPDPRSQKAARKRNVDLSAQRARRVTDEDFAHYHYLIAMDRDNLDALRQRCPPQHAAKLHLFLDFSSDHNGQDVPDPYYGGKRGFENVLDLTEAASRGLLEHLNRIA